jgi:hypothetical protein
MPIGKRKGRTIKLQKALVVPASAILILGGAPVASAASQTGHSGFTHNVDDLNARAEARVPDFEITEDSPNSFSATIADGSFLSKDDGSVDVLDENGDVSYTLHADGVTPQGEAAKYEYEVKDNHLSASWKEDAPARGIQLYSGEKGSDGLPKDPKEKAACLASILGIGLSTAAVIVATGGTAAALASAGLGYLNSAAGTVLSCS